MTDEQVSIRGTRDELLGRIANAICDNTAKACGIDRADCWKQHADDFYAEAYTIFRALATEPK